MSKTPKESKKEKKKSKRVDLSDQSDDARALRREASNTRRKEKHEEKKKKKKDKKEKKHRESVDGDESTKKEKKSKKEKKQRGGETETPDQNPLCPPWHERESEFGHSTLWGDEPHKELLMQLGVKPFDGEIAMAVKAGVVFGSEEKPRGAADMGARVPLKVIPAKTKEHPAKKNRYWVEADAGSLTSIFGAGTVTQGGDGLPPPDPDDTSDNPAHLIELKCSQDAQDWTKAPCDKKRKMYLGRREVFDAAVHARYVKVGFGDGTGKTPTVHIGVLVRDPELVPASMLRALCDMMDSVQQDNDDLAAENEELRDQLVLVDKQRCCGVM